MVNKELDNETNELLNLAERVGYLDPGRNCPTTIENKPSMMSRRMSHGEFSTIAASLITGKKRNSSQSSFKLA